MDPSTLSWLNFLIFNKFSLIFHKTTDFLTLTSYSPLELLQYQYAPITVLTSSLSCQEFLFLKSSNFIKQSILTPKCAGSVLTKLYLNHKENSF